MIAIQWPPLHELQVQHTQRYTRLSIHNSFAVLPNFGILGQDFRPNTEGFIWLA